MSTPPQLSQESAPHGWKTAVLLLLVVVALWLTGLWAVTHFIEEPKRGPFGDMFGAVNALFSGLAFAGIIFTIVLQREELRIQRKELEETRHELRGQKEQMELQNKTLSLQSFENTFFQLLRLHNDIVSAIDLQRSNSGEVIAKGRDCFEKFYRYFKERWEAENPKDMSAVELERIGKTYVAFYSKAESDVGHYFRSLYNIVKFVDTASVENKRLYTNLIRAQLSSFEVALLFYNALSPLGSEKFKPLIEKYALLKMTPVGRLIDREKHENLYPPGAYGRAA